MSSTDLEYFRERAVAERALAAAATEPRAAAAHFELARGYDALVRKEEAHPGPTLVFSEPEKRAASA